jgi:hypothetical protein
VNATSTGEVAVYNKINCTVLRKYFERVQSTWCHLTDGNNIDFTTEYSTCGKTQVPSTPYVMSFNAGELKA